MARTGQIMETSQMRQRYNRLLNTRSVLPRQVGSTAVTTSASTNYVGILVCSKSSTPTTAVVSDVAIVGLL